MIVAIALLARSSLLPSNSDLLTLGITLDFLLTIPLVYFLLIRKTDIPKTTVVPVLIVSIVAASYLLPTSQQQYLSLFKVWGLPFIEMTVLTFIILKVRSMVRRYRKEKVHGPDFFTALKETCYEFLPKSVVVPFATEIAVIYYGFINWKQRDILENEYTYHKTSGTPALLGAAFIIIAVETLVLHILLGYFSQIAAWILTGLSIYTAIQVLGIAKSLARRPIVCHNDKLMLRYGIMGEAEIELENIQSVVLSAQSTGFDPPIVRLSPLGDFEKHNVVITLKEDRTLTGLYGFKKQYRVLALHLDKPSEFKNHVDSLCKASSSGT